MCVLGSYMRVTSWMKVDMWLKKGLSQPHMSSGPLPRESHYIPLDTHNIHYGGLRGEIFACQKTPQQTHQSIKHNSSRETIQSQHNPIYIRIAVIAPLQYRVYTPPTIPYSAQLPAHMLLQINTVKNWDDAKVYDSFTQLEFDLLRTRIIQCMWQV